jgi:hypothetical protein
MSASTLRIVFAVFGVVALALTLMRAVEGYYARAAFPGILAAYCAYRFYTISKQISEAEGGDS